jgi:hypothetical protein
MALEIDSPDLPRPLSSSAVHQSVSGRDVAAPCASLRADSRGSHTQPWVRPAMWRSSETPTRAIAFKSQRSDQVRRRHKDGMRRPGSFAGYRWGSASADPERSHREHAHASNCTVGREGEVTTSIESHASRVRKTARSKFEVTNCSRSRLVTESLRAFRAQSRGQAAVQSALL